MRPTPDNLQTVVVVREMKTAQTCETIGLWLGAHDLTEQTTFKSYAFSVGQHVVSNRMPHDVTMASRHLAALAIPSCYDLIDLDPVTLRCFEHLVREGVDLSRNWDRNTLDALLDIAKGDLIERKDFPVEPVAYLLQARLRCPWRISKRAVIENWLAKAPHERKSRYPLGTDTLKQLSKTEYLWGRRLPHVLPRFGLTQPWKGFVVGMGHEIDAESSAQAQYAAIMRHGDQAAQDSVSDEDAAAIAELI